MRRCTYPNIHFCVSKSRLVAWRKHIRTFTLKLSKSRSVVWPTHIQVFVTKTCTHNGLLCPHKKHEDCGHVYPCWRLSLCKRSTTALVWIYITLTIKTLLRNHFVSTLFWNHRKKKQKPSYHCLRIWAKHFVRQQRDDVIWYNGNFFFRVDGFSWSSRGAERCNAPSWTSGVQMRELVTCQSGLVWARRPRRLTPLLWPNRRLERAPPRCAWRKTLRGNGVPRPQRWPRGTRRCLRASDAIRLSKSGTCFMVGTNTVQREGTSPSWQSSCPRLRGRVPERDPRLSFASSMWLWAAKSWSWWSNRSRTWRGECAPARAAPSRRRQRKLMIHPVITLFPESNLCHDTPRRSRSKVISASQW